MQQTLQCAMDRGKKNPHAAAEVFVAVSHAPDAGTRSDMQQGVG
jgi:hypothetical protein